MANPPKQKGTGGETELKKLMECYWLGLERMPASAAYDLQSIPTEFTPEMSRVQRPTEVLATRPDRGQWLITMTLPEFMELLGDGVDNGAGVKTRVPALHVEVKRYKRFSLHTIFEGKFGR